MAYIVNKLGFVAITLFLVSMITFGVFQLLPGNPVDIILGMDADPMQAAALEKELGLDLPMGRRYLNWVAGLFQGDLGQSLKYRMPVSTMLKNSLPVTVLLAFVSMLMTVVIVIPASVFLARHHEKKSAAILSSAIQVGVAVPSFWTGILLIMVFAVLLGLLPSGDYIPFSKDPLASIKSLILPAAAISIGTSAAVIRYLKTTLLEQLDLDYVRTARSKGLAEGRVLYTHVLQNALLPTITILGMMVVDILGGSIIIENVFNLPGIGTLLTSGVSSRDFPLVQAITFYMACTVIIVNLLVDILYGVADPRISFKSAAIENTANG